jgi:hypothetical protein
MIDCFDLSECGVLQNLLSWASLAFQPPSALSKVVMTLNWSSGHLCWIFLKASAFNDVTHSSSSSKDIRLITK